MQRLGWLFTLVLALGLAGCGAQGGETRIKYERSGEPAMTTAPYDGEYALYTATDTTPKVVQRLRKGDRLGFERGDSGRVRAVAGQYNTALPDNTLEAYWKLRPVKD
jgi:hypothetical protein